MTDPNLMPVRVELVKEMLVERIMSEADARFPGTPPAAVEHVLTAPLADLPGCDGGDADLRLRRLGYLCRIAEQAMFEPAQAPLPGLAERIGARTADGEGWEVTATSISAELAGVEPLEKPRPDDDRAVTWKVPGPGGHVRHYVVAAAIADALETEASEASANPDELKRAWVYGFLVRCCEETAPPPPG